MILINNEWHNPKDLDDVSKIVRELFNEELADKMDELLLLNNEGYKDRINELDFDISNLEDEIDSKDYDINELQLEISRLENEIDELREGDE